LLVFEDDARPDAAVLKQGLHHAEVFLSSALPFDLLLLGLNVVARAAIAQPTDAQCSIDTGPRTLASPMRSG
jgi:hypothetical protein